MNVRGIDSVEVVGCLLFAGCERVVGAVCGYGLGVWGEGTRSLLLFEFGELCRVEEWEGGMHGCCFD